MFSTGFTSISVLLLFPLSITFFVSVHSFWFFLFNIDEILLINPSANVFVFGDIHLRHKDWLTYSGGTDESGELCYSFSFSNDLTQMLNFPPWIPGCDSYSPALFYFFYLSSDASIWSTMAFPPLGIRIMLSQFPLTFHHVHNRMLHFIAFLVTILMLLGMVFVIIWEMFDGRMYLNSVLLLLLVNFVSAFRLELMYISLIESTRSSFSHVHDFQLFVLVP